MKFDRNFIAEVKSSADIVSLISESVDLKKSGPNFKGLCPFHADNAPSMQVKRAKGGQPGRFHCYVCATGGDAIDWAVNRLNLTFYDAIAMLASRSGLSLPEHEQASPDAITRKQLSRLLQRANGIYQHGLRKSAEHRMMLTNGRGLSDESINKWQLGVVSKGIAPFLKACDSDLLQSGIIGITEDNRIFERLRMRVTIPIYTHAGFLTGFAGRRMDIPGVLNTKAPKYINPPENLLFSKGKLLFGLDKAAPSIRRDNRAIVVEGYFDVIMLHQAGEDRAVGGMGTAFTLEQILLLLRYTNHITLCLDGDSAGKRSAIHFCRLILPILPDGVTIDFLWLPDDEDPDSFIQHHGITSWAALLVSAMPLSEFLLAIVSQAEKDSSVESRVQALLKAKELVSLIKPSIFRQVLLQALSERYGDNVVKELANV